MMTVGDLRYYIRETMFNIKGLNDDVEITNVAEHKCTYPYLVTRDGCYPLFELDIYGTNESKKVTMEELKKVVKQ